MYLVIELVAVDGCAAAAGAGGIAALDHEGGDDAVEGGGVVVASAGEGGKVVACLRGSQCLYEIWSSVEEASGYLWCVFGIELYCDLSHGRYKHYILRHCCVLVIVLL